MEGIRRESATARALAAALKTRFVVADVGCSGGIDTGWRVFGDRLTAYGFDPGQAEITRLRGLETDANVHYINGFVGVPPGHPLRDSGKIDWRTNPWRRLSAFRTVEIHQASENGAPLPPFYSLPRISAEEAAQEAAWLARVRAEEATDDKRAPVRDADRARAQTADPDAAADMMRRNRWEETELADDMRPIVLPDFFADNGVRDLDFVKIDVDGADFDILRSLNHALDDLGVLGVMLEVNYTGSDHPDANTFHNVDRFMRAHGFDLLDLTVRRYSLDDLPSPFLFDHPYAAQTVHGRPIQGDALYVRDFGYPSNGPDPADWSDEKLIKQAAICALFGLLDHAAELLITQRERLGARLDIDAVLNLIAEEAQGLDGEIDGDFAPFASYRDLLDAYEADHLAFYGANSRRHDNRQRIHIDSGAASAERDRLVAQNLALSLELDKLRQEHSAVIDSTVWRASAPLRSLMARLLGRR